MKTLNYIQMGAIVILIGLLFMKQCSGDKTQNQLNDKISIENEELKLKLKSLQQLNDALTAEIEKKVREEHSQTVETKIVYKYKDRIVYKYTTDTLYRDSLIYIDTTQSKSNTVDAFENYFLDSLYKVSTTVLHNGEVKSFKQDLTRLRVIEEIEPIIIDNTKTFKIPRLFVTTSVDFDTDLKTLDFNMGLMYQDKKFRQFGVSKTLNNKTQYQINYNHPLIFSKY